MFDNTRQPILNVKNKLGPLTIQIADDWQKGNKCLDLASQSELSIVCAF